MKKLHQIYDENNQNLHKTLVDLKKNKAFSLFHPELSIIESISTDILLPFEKYKGAKNKSNRFFVSPNYIYLKDATSNLIFIHILGKLNEYYLKKYEKLDKSLYDTTYKEEDLNHKLTEIISNIIKDNGDKQGKHTSVFIAKMFKLFFEENKDAFIYVIKKELSNMFIINQRKNKGSLTLSKAKVTFDLGLIVIKFMISHYKKISDFSAKIIIEDIKKLTEEEIELFIDIIKSLNNHEENNQTHKLYTRFNIFDEKHQQIIELYLQHKITSFLFKYNSNLPKKIKDIVKDFDKNHYFNVNRKWSTKNVQIGNLILTGLIKENIVDTLKKQQGNHIIMCVTIKNLNLFPNLLELYLFKKPLLSRRDLPLKKLDGLFNNFIKKEQNDENKIKITNLYNKLTDYYNLYDIALKERKERVRNNQNTTLKSKNGYYSHTQKTKFCVDKLMLNLFLIELQKANNNSLMLLYGYSHEYFESIRSKYNNDYIKNALTLIKSFMITFDDTSFTNFRKNVLKDHVVYEGKDIIKTIIDKVEQYKYTLVGSIKDAILYSKFDFFFADSFLDSRGRLYNRESFLNIQNNPQSKMFIKLYVSPDEKFLDQKSWDIIRKHIKEPYDTIYNLKKDISVKSLLVKLNYSIRNFIYEMFDSKKLTREAFDAFLETFIEYSKTSTILLYLEETKAFIKAYVKKPKLIWVTLANLIRFVNGEGMIEYDANNSGLQMLSILFKDHMIATQCNLMGAKNIDSYVLILTAFKDVLLDIERILDTLIEKDIIVFALKTDLISNDIAFDFKKVILNYMPKNFEKTKQEYKDIFYKIMQRFLTFDFMKCIHLPLIVELIHEYYILLFDNYIIKDKTKNISYLIPKYEYNLLKRVLKKQKPELVEFGNYLLSLRVIFKLEQYYNKYYWLKPNSNIWNNRELFKKPLMTLYYNATSITRREHFDNFFKENQGMHAEKIQKNFFNYFIRFIDRFFVYYVSKHVQGKRKINNLTRALISKNKTIQIENKFFKIDIAPYVYKTIQVETHNVEKKRQQIAIKIPTSQLNLNKMRLTASPNIIHSMDAFIVHAFNSIIKELNSILKVNGSKYKINFYTNHDTFACSLPLLSLVFLKEAYCSLIKEDYMNNCLKTLLKKDKSTVGSLISAEEFENYFLKNFNSRFMK